MKQEKERRKGILEKNKGVETRRNEEEGIGSTGSIWRNLFERVTMKS